MAEFKSRGFVSEFEFPIFPKHRSLQLVICRRYKITTFFTFSARMFNYVVPLSL